MQSVYKIVTKLPEDSDTNFLLTREEEKEIHDFNMIAVDFIEDGFIGTYLISNKKVLDRMSDILRKYDISFEVEDVTEKLLLGKEIVEDENFYKFIEDNLTKDIVLDKINEMGIDSLSDIDISILEKK